MRVCLNPVKDRTDSLWRCRICNVLSLLPRLDLLVGCFLVVHLTVYARISCVVLVEFCLIPREVNDKNSLFKCLNNVPCVFRDDCVAGGCGVAELFRL